MKKVKFSHLSQLVDFDEGHHVEYKEYIEKYGMPYSHKETNKGKLSFLRDFPKVSFNDLSYSLIADDLGAAFGFRSDSVFEILKDSNKKYTE